MIENINIFSYGNPLILNFFYYSESKLLEVALLYNFY